MHEGAKPPTPLSRCAPFGAQRDTRLPPCGASPATPRSAAPLTLRRIDNLDHPVDVLLRRKSIHRNRTDAPGNRVPHFG